MRIARVSILHFFPIFIHISFFGSLHYITQVLGTLAMLVGPELNGIEGLKDLHDDMLTRRTALQDLLIDELHVSVYVLLPPSSSSSSS